MVGLDKDIRSLHLVLPSIVNNFLFITTADGHKVRIEYLPKMKILRATVTALDVALALHADDIADAINLLKRALWRCERRPGYVCLIDDSCMTNQWVRAAEFERRLKQRITEEE